jgi:hypothetical protein
MGEALGRAGVSVEGGGAWVVDGRGVAHFLFADGAAARRALEAAGIQVLAEREVLVQRLKQDVPGQLGLLTRRMVDAGQAQNWLIMKNGDHAIGLFQGMFEKNILTFNPGWDSDAQKLGTFTDVREISGKLDDCRSGRQHDSGGPPRLDPRGGGLARESPSSAWVDDWRNPLP